jgi:hypothetical protein
MWLRSDHPRISTGQTVSARPISVSEWRSSRKELHDATFGQWRRVQYETKSRTQRVSLPLHVPPSFLYTGSCESLRRFLRLLAWYVQKRY